MKRFLLFIICLFTLQGGCLHASPKHEIRAVWLTTIYGLDWPTSPARTPQEEVRQQNELTEMLDRLAAANFNTVFLQVRMRGDVIYRSAIEPAGAVFTGTYGKLPGYDPLAFALQECHRRGMECHAWFVTFPVGNDRTVKQQGSLSVMKRRPELVKRHNGEYYLDPGLPATSDYLLTLVRELVSNYDIDGIHFDYIRYPEKANRFPDKSVHSKYGKQMRLDDWRRENINQLVYHIYDTVKEIKPWVQVSSSPLGKYNRIERKPDAEWTAYESVFQDPGRWFAAGKHDLVVPMMYYQEENYYPFVDNWVELSGDRLFVPGLGAYRLLKDEGDWELPDITGQLDYGRSQGANGSTFFRSAQILQNTKGIYDALLHDYFRYPAQQPPLPWLNDEIPPTPQEILIERNGNELKFTWEPLSPDYNEYTYTVYYSLADKIDKESSSPYTGHGHPR